MPVLFRSDRPPDTERRQAEFLQRLDVELNSDRLGRIEEAHIDSELLIGGIVMLEIQCLIRNVLHPERTVIDIVFQLVCIGRAAALILSIRAAPTRIAGQCPACADD